ncbi:MAG: FxsA family protein [Kiritimatiellales bacterium]|nr:FxsA family protein [Kiritimatiellales bacterium]MCF7863264.1 FxsA family protein [Kiritimatiellales bacterium]
MPLYYLIALFIGLPIVELALLFEVHGIVGFLPTILLVFCTGMLGAVLVRRQGLSILAKIQQEMACGNVPTPHMIDGVMVLVAGAMLITPGIITDACGFLLLVPFIRTKIRFWLKKKLEEKIRRGFVQVNVKRET